MALGQMKTIEHFTHPGHPLEELFADTEYLCDGCKTLGTGTRFQCRGCNFDLHEYCGRCPRSLSFFMHPHPLSLDVQEAQATRQTERLCDVCGELVEGLFYRCKDCNFDVHPVCTQLPHQLHHALHTVHPLMLQKYSLSSPCAVCSSACNSWRYRCGICSFDIHIECVLTPYVHPPTQSNIPPFYPPPPCDPPSQRKIPPFCPSPPCDSPSQRKIPPFCPPPPPQPHQSWPPYYGSAYWPSSGPRPYDMYNVVNHVQPYGPPPPNYGTACSPYGMYNNVNHVQPYGPPPPKYGTAYSPYGMYNNVNHVQPYGPPPSLPLPQLPHYGPSPYNEHIYVNQPSYSACAVTFGPSPYNTHNYISQADQANQGGVATDGRKRKKMYMIVEQLMLGVLSSVIFGMFSSS